MTDVCHPDNKDMAERTIKAVGLDVGGVDFLTDDITKSYKDIGGAIVEVNAAPGFRMHVAPSEGKPRDVAGKVMDMLFPPGTQSRIPIAAITGTNGKTTTSRMLAHIMKSVGQDRRHDLNRWGLCRWQADREGRHDRPGLGPDGAARPVRRFRRDGNGARRHRPLGPRLPALRCVGLPERDLEDHLGMGGINTVEELAVVKRVVVETATDTVVLNADDLHCLRMADFCHATHICYVTMNSDHALVKEHIRAGGRAVVLEKAMNGDMITVYSKGLHLPVLWSHLVPATLEGKALYNVQNAMFATAMAFSFGLDLDNIRHGLRTFDTSFFQAPGRTNVFDEHPFKVILDYGHNPAAIAAMADLADRLDIKGRRIVVSAMPGDRRDEDIVASARELAGHFDHYVLKPDDDRRGRGPMEVPELLKAALLTLASSPTRSPSCQARSRGSSAASNSPSPAIFW
jgi:cyanophycin synthetase